MSVDKEEARRVTVLVCVCVCVCVQLKTLRTVHQPERHELFHLTGHFAIFLLWRRIVTINFRSCEPPMKCARASSHISFTGAHQGWNSFQGLCGNIRSCLCSHNVLVKLLDGTCNGHAYKKKSLLLMPFAFETNLLKATFEATSDDCQDV